MPLRCDAREGLTTLTADARRVGLMPQPHVPGTSLNYDISGVTNVDAGWPLSALAKETLIKYTE